MQRKTRQREAIRLVLLDAGRPLSPGEILIKARGALPSLGIATVYRAIKVLLAEGTIVLVDIPGQPSRYEMAGLLHHHHFCCTGCARVYGLKGCTENVNSLAPEGFRVEGHDIILYGQCARCSHG